MEDISSSGGYRPATGLSRLTWAQVEKLDAVVKAMCELTARDDSEARVVLVVKRGRLRFVERPMVSEELRPTGD